MNAGEPVRSPTPLAREIEPAMRQRDGESKNLTGWEPAEPGRPQAGIGLAQTTVTITTKWAVEVTSPRYGAAVGAPPAIEKKSTPAPACWDPRREGRCGRRQVCGRRQGKIARISGLGGGILRPLQSRRQSGSKLKCSRRWARRPAHRIPIPVTTCRRGRRAASNRNRLSGAVRREARFRPAMPAAYYDDVRRRA